MKHIFRNSDIFARLGGDEFVALFTNTSKKQTECLVEKFRQSLEKYNQNSCRGHDISFSYGIVEYRSDMHVTLEALLADGDSMMYQFKKSKKSFL